MSISTTALLRRLPLRYARAALAILMVMMTVLVTPATGVSSAAVSVNLDQCANGKISAPANCPPGWSNGNLNENSSHYREGESVAFRAVMTGLATTIPHKLVIQYDNTESSGKHAYDYVTSFNRTVKLANPCAGVAGCSGPTPTGTAPIPTDPSLANAVPPVSQVAGTMAIYNGAIAADGVKYVAKSANPEGKSLQTTVEIAFTAASSTVVLAWGGHIASALDWGTGDSANAIPGSPYHMRIVSLDGSGGNQDRSLKAAAVLPMPAISTQVTDAAGASVNQIQQYSGAAVRDVATLSGPNGPVTGTVDFYVCGPASAPMNCDPGTAKTYGQFLGTAPINPPGKATSPFFTPDSGVGTLGRTYCFLAIYTPRDDDTSPYSPGYHTNQSLAIPENECFQIGAPATPALQLTKTADNATVNAGEQLGFTIAVSNGSGGGPALGVTITDTLPVKAGLGWSLDPAVEGCAIAGGVLTCDFGDLAPGTSKSVHVVSPTTYDSCGTISNTGALNLGGTANASVVVNCPSLSVTKTADAATVNTGGTIGFTVRVSNAGPGVAKNVALSDPLPAGTGVDWSIADGSDPDCAIVGTPPSEVLSCAGRDMAANTSFSVNVTSQTTGSSAKTYDNTATAMADNHPNRQASASATVLGPQLTFSKMAEADTVSAGDQIAFTLTVSNAAGAGTATGVTITDTLPTNPGLGWSVDPAVAGCAIDGGVLTCTFATLAPDTSRAVRVTSPTTAATCGTVSNTATLTTANNGTDSKSASIAVDCPSLAVVKDADGSGPGAVDATVSTGDAIGFTITVTNSGAGTARGVTLSDPLPVGAGLSWSVDTPNSPCTIAPGDPGAQPPVPPTLNCPSIGDLAPNASFSVHVTSGTGAGSAGVYPNTATAGATNAPQATGTATITVQAPSLSVTKTADNTTVAIGGTIGFTITVGNAGPGAAKNVRLSDPLPAGTGVNWAIAADSPTAGPTCVIAPAGGPAQQTLSCAFGTLAAGASVTVHVTSPTTAGSAGTYANTVTVRADNSPDKTSTAQVAVQSATLTIVKTDDAGAPLGGATFTLYTGTGPDLTATGYSCTTGDSGTCTITGIVPGAYTVQESGTPAGYAPAAEQTATLAGGETATLTFENQRLFTIVVVVCQESTGQFYSSTVTIGAVTYVSLSQAAAKAAGMTDQQIAAFCSISGGARSAGNTARAQPYPASVVIPVTPLPEVGKTE